jgi:hypothetical protein
MLTLKKFRLVIVSNLLTVLNRRRSVIGNGLYVSVRWRGGGVSQAELTYGTFVFVEDSSTLARLWEILPVGRRLLGAEVTDL